MDTGATGIVDDRLMLVLTLIHIVLSVESPKSIYKDRLGLTS